MFLQEKENTQKDIKQSLGIAIYFSDHIQNYAIIAKRIRFMMLP